MNKTNSLKDYYDLFEDTVIDNYSMWFKNVKNGKDIISKNHYENSIMSILDVIFKEEGYTRDKIDLFLSRYGREANESILSEWMIKNRFFIEMYDLLKNETQFFNHVLENIDHVNQEEFKNVYDLMDDIHKLVLLLKIFDYNSKEASWKRFFTRFEYLDEFEKLCDGELVLSSDISKKRPIINSSTQLRRSMSDVFVSLCKSEKTFDKWVEKNTRVHTTSPHYFYSYKIINKTSLPFFKKIIETNTKTKIKICKNANNPDVLEKIIDIIFDSKIYKKSNHDVIFINKVIDKLKQHHIEGNFTTERMEKIIFKVGLKRKGIANHFALRNQDICKNYLAYKKL